MTHRVLVSGWAGRMGRAVVEAVTEAPDMQFVGGVGREDDLEKTIRDTKPTAIVDFTVPESALPNIKTSLAARVPIVVGTTGLSAADVAAVDDLAKTKNVGAIIAPNFALGAVLMMKFAREIARHFPHAEIIELHHEDKHEAPSGTAMQTAAIIGESRREVPTVAHKLELVDGARGGSHHGVPIHSVRMPGLVAHQEVMFGAAGQTLRVRHDLYDRRSFMPGVLLAIRHVGRLTGVHDLESLLTLDD